MTGGETVSDYPRTSSHEEQVIKRICLHKQAKKLPSSVCTQPTSFLTSRAMLNALWCFLGLRLKTQTDSSSYENGRIWKTT